MHPATDYLYVLHNQEHLQQIRAIIIYVQSGLQQTTKGVYMKGWLIVNRFLNNGKFSELYDWLIKAAKKAGSELVFMTNADIIVRADTREVVYPGLKNDRPDYVIFWDKDIRLARALEAAGLKLYNCADAIEACDDKSLTCSRLAGTVRMPATFNVPFTYEGPGYCDTGFLKQIESQTGYPFVLKECFGSFGEQVHLIQTREQCEEILKSINGHPCIIQEYISPGDDIRAGINNVSEEEPVSTNLNTRIVNNTQFSGRDIRIIVVGGRCIAAMVRYNDNDFRANIALGGHAHSYTPTEAEQAMAIKVCNTLKLDYAGVDILTGSDDKPLLCEVNSNAHFKGIFECTGINAADAIIEHILSLNK